MAVRAAVGTVYLLELHTELHAGTYRLSPVKRVEILKRDGKTRPLGIPTVKDRIVQAALKLVIEPVFEVQFREGSYGFDPGQGRKDALREVDRLLKEGNTFVADADLKGYFDSLPHDRLMALVEGSISDRRVLTLIESFLRQDIMTETARWQPGQGFDFLGYRFEAGVRFVRAKSLKAIKDKVTARTIRSRRDSLRQIVADHNPMLRGWLGYFKHARPRLFRRLDGPVRRRLRAILRKQENRPSMGRSEADHRRWTDAIFAGQGLFTLQAARAAARHSR